MTLNAEISLGRVVKYKSPNAEKDQPALIGMILFVASWLMLFAGLFFSYAMLRVNADVWPPFDAPALPLALGALNSVLIAMSSLALHRGYRGIKNNEKRQLVWALATTFVLGCAFVGLQGYSWMAIYHQGLAPSSGSYGSVFYGTSRNNLSLRVALLSNFVHGYSILFLIHSIFHRHLSLFVLVSMRLHHLDMVQFLIVYFGRYNILQKPNEVYGALLM